MRSTGKVQTIAPGVYVNCTIITAEKNDALKLSNDALIFREEGTCVFVVNKSKGTVEKRVLTLGLSASGAVEVLEGHNIVGLVMNKGDVGPLGYY